MKMKRYIHDPVLQRSSFRCAYCGRNLLEDLDLFLSLVRDHFQPKSAGGGDGHENRVLSCVTCDRLKGSRQFATIEEAAEFVRQYRENASRWFVHVREFVEWQPKDDDAA